VHPIRGIGNSEPSSAVDEANRRTGPDSIAKILYTSGSTGLPRRNHHSPHALLEPADAPPNDATLADEPLSCATGCPGITLLEEATFWVALQQWRLLYIDAGKPTPDLFGETAAATCVRSPAPTAYFNVPKGYEMLVEHLRTEPGLAQKLSLAA